MNIVVTGSIGHISKPLIIQLVKEGHFVNVISRDPERKKEIESLGANASIGSIKDLSFLKIAFAGKDAAYCMIPPFPYFDDPNLDYKKSAIEIAKNYSAAIKDSGVKKVIHLSSVGAEKNSGTGLLVFHHLVEEEFKKLPEEVSLVHIRPVSFYYNLYQFSEMIKGEGFLAGFLGKLFTLRYYGVKGLWRGYSGIILSNYGNKDSIPWVSTKDIALAIAEEMNLQSTERKVRYVASEELICREVATIIGKSIGKPFLKWVLISDKQMISAIKKLGASAEIARELTEMNASMHNGSLFEDYYKNKPEKMGEIKMWQFAKSFAANYK